ncbi:MAG: Acetone carboxylase gamma subunit [Acidimicrobiales bacterium]|nr:MAG: acetone carboxylase subunit gamma [Actinomycetota bacterium]MBV6508675.1 Acetone carboxylase gamma subunit [Acidimicrobiales bacterium]RIK08211.1 MAG: acetone carboxylase subunit gamma [Acidobacteriota bacterium]
MAVSKDDLRDLFAGTLAWDKTKEIISGPKDDDRFEAVLELLQEQVRWPERILLPLREHLYIVESGGSRIVKCDCGHEFGDWRRNWKMSAAIIARDDIASMEEIYPGLRRPDPNLCEIREFICPGCGVLLDVESVPVGYPVVFDALPDIDVFYDDWLGRPLEDHQDCEDRTAEIISKWAKPLL